MVNGRLACAVIYGAVAVLSALKEADPIPENHILPAKSSRYLLFLKLPAAVVAVYSSGSDRDVA